MIQFDEIEDNYVFGKRETLLMESLGFTITYFICYNQKTITII